jgi:hypothetical protein
MTMTRTNKARSVRLDALTRTFAQEGRGKIVIPTVERYLLSRKPDYRDPFHLHPSEMAKKEWCERASYYRITTGTWPPKDKFSFTLQSVFDEGHQIHDKWQMWLKASGKLWGDWCCSGCGFRQTCEASELTESCYECGMEMDDPWVYEEVGLSTDMITGFEDAAIGDRLVEFKSLGLGTLRVERPELLQRFHKHTDSGMVYDIDGIWKALNAPLKSHVRQANIYLWMCQQMGGVYRDFRSCSIVYEYKANQQAKEFFVPMSEKVLEPLLDRVGYVEVALAQERPPRCPQGGCKQCQSYEKTP